MIFYSYPPVNVHRKLWKDPPFLMGKLSNFRLGHGRGWNIFLYVICNVQHVYVNIVIYSNIVI